MLTTPVAFLIFNRPDLTERVFQAIAKAKPQKLLVVADGPRFPEEAEKCQQARAVIKNIDWNCEVLTNFSPTNLGCKNRISSGLDWVFSEVEEAIILEDDCLPTPSFFDFCQTLLEYYRYDRRVMTISGDNFQLCQSRTPYSYYFSKYNYCWGWASWQRAWQYYDIDMTTWPEYKQANLISSMCEIPAEQKYWTNIFDRTFENAINSWAYRLTYACWSQNGLSILPNVNLVSNIGFDSSATHTINNHPFANLPTSDIWNIQHPPFVARNREADDFTFKYLSKSNTIIKQIEHHLLNKLKLN